ncbi:MAG: L,D-transpeptidase family protein [candidate division WOR-3 bacterium]
MTGPLQTKVSITGAGRLAVERIELFRSTTRFDDSEPDTTGCPVTVFDFPGGDSAAEMTDSMLAHNAKYYYRARLSLTDGRQVLTNPDSVVVPDTALGCIFGLSIIVDKKYYFLEVRDGGRTKKRYPIALGRDPRRRKLHQDNATTPEGIYHITGEQLNARFYKALDIDYPNEVDRTRYNLAKTLGLVSRSRDGVPGIGGEIQIHGGGIERNWTNGCIALRNADMDELFGHERIGKGVPVVIVGNELNRADISSIQDYRTPAEVRTIQRKLAAMGHYQGRPDGTVGEKTRQALGRFQWANELPMTCELDCRTVALLASQP